MIVSRFLAPPFNQNLHWDNDAGQLTCVRNVFEESGWRLETLDLKKAVADGRARGPAFEFGFRLFRTAMNSRVIDSCHVATHCLSHPAARTTSHEAGSKPRAQIDECRSFFYSIQSHLEPGPDQTLVGYRCIRLRRSRPFGVRLKSTAPLVRVVRNHGERAGLSAPEDGNGQAGLSGLPQVQVVTRITFPGTTVTLIGL
jgi:hypothetical protein